MAPQTRSANAITDFTSDMQGVDDSPSNTPGRKVPHCAKCKRPRAGHPRTGCPYTDSPNAVASPTNSPQRKGTRSGANTPGRRNLASSHLTDAMGSMQIRASTPLETDEELNATRRNRRRSQPLERQTFDSLRSLSSSSNEIAEMLMQPGILEEDTEPEGDSGLPASIAKGRPARVIRWGEAFQALDVKLGVQSRPKSSPQSPMPGTLYTPNPSFFESQSSMPVKQEEKPRILVSSPTGSYDASQSFRQPPISYKVKPLTRTMSMEQRDFFISQLGTSSKATIHVLPKATVDGIAEEARDMGFLADILMNDDDEDSQALLVVGRDDNEVDRVLERVRLAGQGKLQEFPLEKTSSTSSTACESRSRLTAVAGGAVVGAVGAWAGLAFT